MSDSHSNFDPYRKWLGIPPEKQPPNYYQLLGISLNEEDLEVIRAAAEQRKNFVAAQRGKGHEAEVNAILYQLQEAELTLLDSELRRDYDRRMQLFEKRKRNRRVDPNVPVSPLESQSGPVVGEDSGLVRVYFGIVAILCVAFGVMAWFSFQLPWNHTNPVAARPAPVAETTQPVAEKPAEPTPEPTPALPAKPTVKPLATPVVRIRLTIDRSGRGTFSLARTTEPLATVEGRPIPSSDGSAVVRVNGLAHYRHDFQVMQNLAASMPAITSHAVLDPFGKGLVFTPQPAPEGYDVGRVAELKYARRFRLPLTLTVDLLSYTGGGINLQLMDQTTDGGLLICRLFGTDMTPSVTWVDRSKNRNDQTRFQYLVPAAGPFEGSSVSYSFQIPLESGSFTRPMLWAMQFYQVRRDAQPMPATISLLTFESELIPSYGLALKPENGQIVIDRVLPNSAAAQAGIRVGDKIEFIDDTPVSDVADALERLGRYRFGEEAPLQLEREGQPFTTRLVGR